MTPVAREGNAGRRSVRAAAAALVAMSTVTVACGTRVERAARPATLSGASESGRVAPADAGAPIPQAAEALVAPGAVPAGNATPSGTAASAPATPERRPTARGQGVSGAAAAAPTSESGNTVSTGRSPNPAGQPAPRPGATPGPAPPTGKLSTLVLASVGTYSGPAGGIIAPMLQGAQMWVRAINAGGGLGGHPVNLIVYDDGGDPARHRAQVQEAVEQKKVVAFLMNGEALTGQGSVEYLNAKRVPVIGQTSGEGSWVYESPMYFPQAANAQPLARSLAPAFASQMVPKGKTKLASLVCVEAGGCNDFDRIVAETAPKVGFQHVYRARASIAQPDYTAECLSARNAGAEVFFVALDQNSVGRVSTACGRQGYRPTFAIYGPAVIDAQSSDPNLTGAIAMSNVVPYFQTGTAATDEFQAVLKSFGKGVPRGIQGPVLGWVAGKLLERAATRLSEPPTSESVLAGLWSIQGDTLGGLTQPLTFRKDQPAEPKSCWFNMAIADGRWTSPDNSAVHCL